MFTKELEELKNTDEEHIRRNQQQDTWGRRTQVTWKTEWWKITAAKQIIRKNEKKKKKEEKKTA